MNFLHKIPIFFWSIFYPIKIYGKENIPSDGAILVCNHFRAMDCGFVARAYDKDIKFLAKKEIFKNKLFSKIVTSYGGIPIDRDNPDLKSLLAAIRTVKDGHKLCIFAEGTRNKSNTNQLQELKSGTALFAVKAKCPIVPIMMYKKAKIFRRTHMIIGKPFTLEPFYDKKLSQEEQDEMDNIVREKMIEQQDILTEIINSKKA